jgi:hypothetical protein
VTVFIPTIHDVKALDDVVNDITELSDSLKVDDAVAFRVALVAHQAKVKFAIDMLDAQLVKTLEMPRTEGGWIHQVRRKKDKQRFDHAAIARAIREEALLDDEGLLMTAREAVEEAVSMMQDVYISDSSKAKIGALKSIGIDRKDVETFERGDLYVDVTPVLSEVQE